MSKLQFGGREYLRNAAPPNRQLLGAVKVAGRTAGGGLVLLPPVTMDGLQTPTWLVVEVADLQVSYGLLCGP